MIKRVYKEKEIDSNIKNIYTSNTSPANKLNNIGRISFSENREGYDSTHSEKALWRAVIVQALMDAASQSKKKENQIYRDEALVWLRGNSADFYTVCSNAGFNPECIRNLARTALENNCKWRAAPGEGKRKCKNRTLSASGRAPTNSR